jgi:hypothetical protein
MSALADFRLALGAAYSILGPFGAEILDFPVALHRRLAMHNPAQIWAKF